MSAPSLEKRTSATNQVRDVIASFFESTLGSDSSSEWMPFKETRLATNRNITINGISFTVHDIDLRKYTDSSRRRARGDG